MGDYKGSHFSCKSLPSEALNISNFIIILASAFSETLAGGCHTAIMGKPYCEVKSFSRPLGQAAQISLVYSLWEISKSRREEKLCPHASLSLSVCMCLCVRAHTHTSRPFCKHSRKKVALRATQFANNEHLLCSVLAEQSILVRDWSRAIPKAVCLFRSEKYSNDELPTGLCYYYTKTGISFSLSPPFMSQNTT